MLSTASCYSEIGSGMIRLSDMSIWEGRQEKKIESELLMMMLIVERIE